MAKDAAVLTDLEKRTTRKPGLSKAQWIGVIAGVLILLGILYLTFSPFRQARLADNLIQAQLDSLREGNIQQAYSFFSYKFKEKNSVDDFRKFIERNPSLSMPKEFQVKSSETDQGVITLEGVLRSMNGSSLPMKYRIVSENGNYKIRYLDAGPIQLSE